MTYYHEIRDRKRKERTPRMQNQEDKDRNRRKETRHHDESGRSRRKEEEKKEQHDERGRHETELDQSGHRKKREEKMQHNETGRHPAEESRSKKPLPILPEEVLEMIIAKIPFPAVLKARMLSISWHHKFSRSWEGSRHQVLSPFQKEVTNRSVSHDCQNYCPVFICNKGLRVFDRLSYRWKSMFPIGKMDFATCGWVYTTSYSFAGSLMLESSLCTSRSGRSRNFTSIRNVVTGCSRELPRLRKKESQPLVIRLLPGVSLTSYRVLHIHRVRNAELSRDELETALYDSEVGGWSSVTESKAMPNWVGGSSRRYDVNNVFLHGKLYCLCAQRRTGYHRYDDPYVLGVNHLDSDQKNWTSARLSFLRGRRESDVNLANLVRCGERVMVVLDRGNCRISIYELDLEELGLCTPLVMECNLPVERGISRYTSVASDEDFIYIGQSNTQTPLITYNVTTGVWGTLPPPYQERPLIEEIHTVMLSSGFKPGPNPFALVDAAK